MQQLNHILVFFVQHFVFFVVKKYRDHEEPACRQPACPVGRAGTKDTKVHICSQSFNEFLWDPIQNHY